jgi:hypothetical protein
MLDQCHWDQLPEQDQKVLWELAEWLEWSEGLNCRGMTIGEMFNHVDGLNMDVFHEGYPLLSNQRLREVKERVMAS